MKWFVTLASATTLLAACGSDAPVNETGTEPAASIDSASEEGQQHSSETEEFSSMSVDGETYVIRHITCATTTNENGTTAYANGVDIGTDAASVSSVISAAVVIDEAGVLIEQSIVLAGEFGDLSGSVTQNPGGSFVDGSSGLPRELFFDPTELEAGFEYDGDLEEILDDGSRVKRAVELTVRCS